MMNREEMQLRDRLLQMTDYPPSQHKPFMNVKRKPFLAKQPSKGGGPKLSVQDFVRMDPGYTPDIEHLVFPSTRKRNPQQVAPVAAASTKPSTAARTRSRLAEMFALSRHLQQRSADREIKARYLSANRSVDSILDSSSSPLRTSSRSVTADAARRWVKTSSSSAEGPPPPVRQTSMAGARLSPAEATATMATAAATRSSNVSVVHLRSTSEPWETTPSPAFQQTPTLTSRNHRNGRPTSSNALPLTKHQSLGSSNPREYKWQNSPSFHSGGEVNSPDMFAAGAHCNRELSPVRWCDREVDGVYLGKSGWVQVQQRSLDESKRVSFTGNQAKRSQVKLADYHFNSEPSPYGGERPAYLSLQSSEYERKVASPSPPQESLSSPSVTPIISPPPAFQDENRVSGKSRSFFGKTPFLPRSNAIEDSDASPPPSPQWKSSVQSSQLRKPRVVTTQSSSIDKPLRTVRVPQTKSLEDTTANRRSQFSQCYRGSSSSSSSSMGFRSLDSSFNRPGIVMPRLSENTDSSVDHYQDADEEDNNSSSINISMMPIVPLAIKSNAPPRGDKDRISPSSGRSSGRPPHHRSQLRRSPAGSDTNKNLDSSSSSTSSNEFLSKSPPRQGAAQQQVRRSAPPRGYQPSRSQEVMEEAAVQRVRRSRSLQLPDKKPPPHSREPPAAPPPPRASPQHPDAYRTAVKAANAKRHPQVRPAPVEAGQLEEDMLREAEVVAGFLYGNRSRAAAQALLMHRYNNNNISKEEKNKEINKPINNGLTVYYVGNQKKDPQKILVRGATSPSLPSSKQSFERQDIKNPCTSDTCDFWPHCAHRDSLGREANFVMRSSHSYPMHQRSLDSTTPRAIPQDRKIQDQYKRRTIQDVDRRKLHGVVPQKETRERSATPLDRRPSPNGQAARPPPDARKASPTAPGRPRGAYPAPAPAPRAASGSSSGSDAWLTASGRPGGVTTPPASRPGSAPSEGRGAEGVEGERKSMSLPKSFLSTGGHAGSHIGNSALG